MSRLFSLALAAACAGVAGPVLAATINFDDLAAGSTLSNQYAALGVTFTPDAFSGAGSSSSGLPWATGTDMTIVSITDTSNVGNLGTPTLVSGNVLHSFSAWFDEVGDPSFRVSFASPISSFSATFAGISASAGADVTLWAYNGATLVGTVSASNGANNPFQTTLTITGASITSVAVRPGSNNDWVAVDNIVFTPSAVPELGTYATMSAGIALLALKRRRRV